MVGSTVTPADHSQLRRPCRGPDLREEDPRWHSGVPVRRETIPVRFGGETIAVLSADTNLAVPGCPSRWRSPTWAVRPTCAR